MKIVFIAPRYHTNQHEIVKKLLAEGWDVEFHVALVGPTEDHSLLTPKLYEQCPLSKLLIRILGEGGVNRPRAFPSPRRYYKDLKNSRPDYIVLRSPNRWFSILGAFCARLLGIKIIYYTQTALHKAYSPSRRIAVRLLLMLFDAAWFTPLKGEPDRYPYHPKWMYFVPFAVPIWQKTPRISNGVPKILMVGKMQPRKNHILLIHALAQVKRKISFSLTMVGECVTDEQNLQKDEVSKAIEKLGLSDCVNLVLNVPFRDMQHIYDEHDLFVLPSRNEEGGISVLEAYANGLPAICSSTCGTRFYIQDGINGFVFRCGDVDDLVEKLLHLIGDSLDLQAMKKTSLELGRASVSAKNFYGEFQGMLEHRWPNA